MRGRDAGFALVNALVIVAAMAAAALFLLQRGEAARLRLEQGRDQAQLLAYLDGAEAFMRIRLDADRRLGAFDHPGESWARSPFSYDIDRGRVTGTVRDLQGLFAVNGLDNPEDVYSQTTFDNLLAELNLPPSLGEALRDWIRGRAGPDANTYLDRTPPIRPSGGSIKVIDQLRPVVGMTPARLADLRAVLAAGEQENQMNINSAPRAVIQAAMPKLRPAEVSEIVAHRRLSPFETQEEFLAYLQLTVEQDRLETIEAERFGVSSEWIEMTVTANLGTAQTSRRVIFNRSRGNGRAQIVFRQPVDPLEQLQ